ncbi:hypothetical protein MD588_25180 [Photobacterium sp. SDRW27]|uniref:hypothetical protein n=1 Tax=Photobacterium obscurum TaxID=2829490 RepID=UPI002243968C|nr:hypothetical protein [Photobacterium obscurum]MCW8332091.1 hypothetical protein [Photobacterium obscurum]
MKEQVREADIVCRSGGEEFLIFLGGSSISYFYDIAERIRTSIIEQADNALYSAKRNGRNRTEMFEPALI